MNQLRPVRQLQSLSVTALCVAVCFGAALAHTVTQAAWRRDVAPLSANVSIAPAVTAVVRVGDGSTATYSVTAGGMVTVPVEVVNAANLGAATVSLAYDPAVVQPQSCARPSDSAFEGGVCNIAPAGAPGTVRFNVVAPHGVSGAARLVEIGFRGAGGGSGATSSALRPTVLHFADLAGNDLPVAAADGEVRIVDSAGPAQVILRAGDLTQNTYLVTPGASTEIPLTFEVTDTVRLGAATVLLRYAPEIVRPTRCTLGSGYSGYCNSAFDPAGGLVKLNLAAETGLTGVLRPFSVTFEAASGVTAGESNLTLIVDNLADPSGAGLTWQAVNGLAQVSGEPVAAALVKVGEASGAYTVAHGLTQTVTIWVEDAVDLGAATVALRFDPAVARAVGCAVHNDSGISGGCAFAADQARASLIASAGLTGTLPLFDVMFTPAVGALAGASSSLNLTIENFVDAAVRPVTSWVRNGSLTVVAGGGPDVLLVRVGDSVIGGAYELPLAGSVAVTLSVEGAGEVGAASVTVSYDRAVVRAVACGSDPSYDGGFCNPAAADGTTRLSVLGGPAFVGVAPLGIITFQPADGATAGSTTPITVTVTNLAGPMGNPLPHQVAPGQLTLTPASGVAPQVTLYGGGTHVVGIGGLAQAAISATVMATETQHGLAAATLLLRYDPAIVEPVRCALRATLWGGACNLAHAPGQIKLNALSATGLTGAVDIADVVFRGISAAGLPQTSSLTLSVSNLADPAAEPLTYRAEAGAIQVAGSDSDGDGVGEDVEAGAPYSGDGNQDGVPDAQQANVVSLPNAITGDYITLAGPPQVALKNTHVVSVPAGSTAPAGVQFPLGFISFQVTSVTPGSAVALTLTLPPGVTIGAYYRYGPVPQNPQPHWYRYDFDGVTGAITYTDHGLLVLVDGGRGDDDLAANGVIVDPLAPADTGEAAPSLIPVITLAAENNDVRLSWSHNVAYSQGYKVWYSLRPYFQPGDADATLVRLPAGATGYLHPDALDAAPAWYYLVQGVNPLGQDSLPSRRGGVFRFRLTPGLP